jgi:hypothetical protein
MNSRSEVIQELIKIACTCDLLYGYTCTAHTEVPKLVDMLDCEDCKYKREQLGR